MRIRSIKPEFWRSDDITSLPIEERLLFIGLWSYVDDNGVGRDNIASITADLFAEDLASSPRETLARMHRGLERLHNDGMIARYTVAGRSYLHITAWTRHQKIDRPSTPRYPGPDQAEQSSSRDTRETLASPRRALDAGAGDQGAGEQRIREQIFDRSLTLIDQVEPAPTEQELFDRWYDTYPRKVSKPAARKAFPAALRKIGQDRVAATEELITATHEHTRHWKELEGRSISKIPHPATWLNAEAWNDELPDDTEYQQHRTTAQTETNADRINRQRAETFAALEQMGDSNGNTAWSNRTALGA